jgi:hypothetical protein
MGADWPAKSIISPIGGSPFVGVGERPASLHLVAIQVEAYPKLAVGLNRLDADHTATFAFGSQNSLRAAGAGETVGFERTSGLPRGSGGHLAD